MRAVGDPYPGAFTFDSSTRIGIGEACVLAPRGRHIGLPGQVQGHTGRGFSVLCGDGTTIEITAWSGPPDGRRPKVHARLGPGREDHVTRQAGTGADIARAQCSRYH